MMQTVTIFSELPLLLQDLQCPPGVTLVSWELFLTAGAEHERLLFSLNLSIHCLYLYV